MVENRVVFSLKFKVQSWALSWADFKDLKVIKVLKVSGDST
jgi:hypothetical protein